MTTMPVVTLLLSAAFTLAVSSPAWSQDKSDPKRFDHPVIDKAISQIQETLRELESRGSEHMGGHRVKAIELLKEAQKELREGKAYSRARQDIAVGGLDLNKAWAGHHPPRPRGEPTQPQEKVGRRADKTPPPLPGVKEADAKKIVAGRPYKAPRELVSKKVLTQDQYDKIKDQVTAK